MGKMTKTQANRALQAIGKKAFRLFEYGYIKEKDLLDFARVTERALKRMK